MIQVLAKALDCNYRSIYEPSLYEVANPEDLTEKHIAVGFAVFYME